MGRSEQRQCFDVPRLQDNHREEPGLQSYDLRVLRVLVLLGLREECESRRQSLECIWRQWLRYWHDVGECQTWRCRQKEKLMWIDLLHYLEHSSTNYLVPPFPRPVLPDHEHDWGRESWYVCTWLRWGCNLRLFWLYNWLHSKYLLHTSFPNRDTDRDLLWHIQISCMRSEWMQMLHLKWRCWRIESGTSWAKYCQEKSNW